MPTRIDTHQHFWQYNERDFDWIEPGMDVLKRDYLPADLSPLLKSQVIDGCIAVQARQSVEETEWLLQLADNAPFIVAVVGWVDLRSDQAEAQLAQFSGRSTLRGIRHVVQSEPDDRFLLGTEFMRGIGALAAHNLSYDLLVTPRQIPAACELVARFPDQRFIVDHIAKPLIKERVEQPWAADLRKLAAFPNVFCKLSGMVTEADQHAWHADDFRPYLDTVFESFGSKRLMIGSDWPVCTLAASYAQVIGIVTDYMQTLSTDEQDAIWGQNAQIAYGL